jgi:tRNA(Phe) wybutosine-synthesizing methylase Tyw3
MPLRINEMTSNIQVTGQDSRLSKNEINMIVNIALEKFREEQEHLARVQEETQLMEGASEIEPY